MSMLDVVEIWEKKREVEWEGEEGWVILMVQRMLRHFVFAVNGLNLELMCESVYIMCFLD